ncbi:hypothetical protein D3C87_1581400 [compost metagenome]
MAVHALVDHVFQVRDGGGVQRVQHAGLLGQLTDAAVHPGHVDGGRVLLLLQLGQRGGGCAHFRHHGHTRGLGVGVGHAGAEGVAPVSAVPGDGDLLVLRACRAGHQ